MVMEPVDLSTLKMRKLSLIAELEDHITDQLLLRNIKELFGENNSVRNIIVRAIDFKKPTQPLQIHEMRQKIVLLFPAALDAFNELEKAVEELNLKANPYVAY